MASESKPDDILEMAVLCVRPGLELDFEQAFGVAQKIIAASPGYLGHQLRRCVEHREQYLLLVRWRELRDHTEGFRRSATYLEWTQLLHRFYHPMPTVEHYAPVRL
jgi:heme-degrading monooxygenase HmoA